MESRIDNLEKRVTELEQLINQGKKKKREKREPSEKQKQHHDRFKKAYNQWAPVFKKENSALKSSDIFKMVHAKLKETK